MPNTTPSKESNLFFYFLFVLLITIIGYFTFQMIREAGKHDSLPPLSDKNATKSKPRGMYELARRPDKSNLSTILKNAHSTDPKKRLMSLRALQYYGSSQAHHILPFLQDPDKTIRITALQIMGNLRHMPAIQPILKNLQGDKPVTLKIMGIQALTKICEGKGHLLQVKPVLEYLVTSIKNTNPAVSGHAGGALRTITNHVPNLKKPSKVALQSYWKEWLLKKRSEKS